MKKRVEYKIDKQKNKLEIEAKVNLPLFNKTILYGLVPLTLFGLSVFLQIYSNEILFSYLVIAILVIYLIVVGKITNKEHRILIKDKIFHSVGDKFNINVGEIKKIDTIQKMLPLSTGKMFMVIPMISLVVYYKKDELKFLSFPIETFEEGEKLRVLLKKYI